MTAAIVGMAVAFLVGAFVGWVVAGMSFVRALKGNGRDRGAVPPP